MGASQHIQRRAPLPLPFQTFSDSLLAMLHQGVA
jgi:hypothetical protein